MKVTCPHCGSDNIMCVDTVVTLTLVYMVYTWCKGEDGLPVHADCGDYQDLLETISPLNPELPYQCWGCKADLASKDLKVEKADEDQDQ